MRGLRLARQDALEEIFALYAARVRWMNEVSIHQWNDTDYLSAYPPDDYADMQRRGKSNFARGREACKGAGHGGDAAGLHRRERAALKRPYGIPGRTKARRFASGSVCQKTS